MSVALGPAVLERIAPTIPAATRGLSVIVAADRSADAEVLALTLEAVGCVVLTTAFEPAVAELTQLVQPDVVIAVVNTPDWQAIPQAVAERAGWRKPFFVALTLPGTDTHPVEGVHLSLNRPVSPEVLYGLVRRFRSLLASIDGFDPKI